MGLQLDNLPTELHTLIVSFACSSPPNFGEKSVSRVLAFVSRYWSSVALPYKYHSLRIAGPRALKSVLAHLENISEQQRRVRHLWIADRCHDSIPGEIYIEVDEAHLHADSTKAIVERLLALLAPSLYSLELHLKCSLYSTSLFASVWALYFPQLVSLQVDGFYPFPSALLTSILAPMQGPNFLRLEHLVLDGVSDPHGLLELGALDYIFPCLKTLEVRGLRCALGFAKEVVAAVTRHANSSDMIVTGAPGSLRLPRVLKSLVLSIAPVSALRVTKRGQIIRADMLTVLASVTSQAEYREVVRIPEVRVIGFQKDIKVT
ncbi:hypothetical protein DFH11DRAFT_1599575 [Phellopilus nigrolimitatus]|nr:hypothetical protein DFH11DRAFT_1599575 [Phellopilus nigrolimitatus]